MGGYSGMCLTQKLVDAYKTRNGKTIQEAAPDEYSEEGIRQGFRHSLVIA